MMDNMAGKGDIQSMMSEMMSKMDEVMSMMSEMMGKDMDEKEPLADRMAGMGAKKGM